MDPFIVQYFLTQSEDELAYIMDMTLTLTNIEPWVSLSICFIIILGKCPIAGTVVTSTVIAVQGSSCDDRSRE